MIKRTTIILITSFIFILPVLSQGGYYDDPDERYGNKSKKRNNEGKWLFGGDLGLGFGNETYIAVEPLVGYQFSPRFIAGGGPVYVYEKSNYYNFKRSSYGGRGIAQFALIKDISELIGAIPLKLVTQTEYEFVNVKPYTVYSPSQVIEFDRTWISNWLIGFGISQPIGRNTNLTLLLMYDVTAHEYSYYNNPFLKISVGI